MRRAAGILDVFRNGYLTYVALAMVAVVAHTASTLEVDSALIAHLARFRDVYIAGSVLGIGVVNVRHFHLARWMIPFGALAGYVAMILMIHGELVYGAMWVLWFLYVGLFYPASGHLTDQRRFSRYVLWLIVAMAAMLVWVYLFSESKGLDLEWKGDRARFTAGLSNPTLLSKLLSTVYWLCVLQFILTRRLWTIGVAAAVVAALLATDVRTDLVGVAAGTGLYLINTRRLGGAKWWMVAAGVAVATLVILGSEYSQINRISTGRWNLWETLVERTYRSGSPVVYLFGTGNGIIEEYHYDNLYLEVLLRYGFVGFVLLLGGLVALLTKLGRQAAAAPTRQARQLASWGSSVVIAISLSGLFLMIFPSLGNSLNVILLPLAVGVSYRLPSHAGASPT